MRLLLLGGTADARKLAQALHRQSVPLIYSVAGLVRMPDVDCAVVSGGFTQFGGLSRYIQQHRITAILDATHPYAQVMSSTAVDVAKSAGIPCWRFHRKPWVPQAGDAWHYFKTWELLLPELKNKQSVFLSAGQIPQWVADVLAQNPEQRQILRTAVTPALNLPASFTWLKAIGPFQYDGELDIIQNHRVDVLVSKNSGGASTVEKLNVCRLLSIPVFMLDRPHLPDADKVFTNHKDCYDYVLQQHRKQTGKTVRETRSVCRLNMK